MRADRRAIAGNCDLNSCRFTRLQVEHKKMGTVLEDDFAGAAVIGTDRRPLDVIVGELSDLLAPTRLSVQPPYVQAMGRARIGQKINPIAMPHRLAIRTLPVGHFARGMVFKIEQPNVGGHPPAIPLPGTVVARVRGVGEPLSIGTNGTVGTVRGREFRGQSATRRHGQQLHLPAKPRERAAEIQQSAVRRPITEGFSARIISDTSRHASTGRNGIEVSIPLVVSHEANRSPVGTELGKRLRSGWTGQRTRQAAAAPNHP